MTSKRTLGILSLATFCILWLWLVAGTLSASAQEAEKAPGRRLAQKATQAPQGVWTTADHSKFEQLKKSFTTPEEVTRECLGCHTEAAGQVMHTIHWTWVCENCGDGTNMGKYGLTLNNFCVSVPGNEPRCTSCHIGYGWKDANFDFNDPHKVDCLVCHEQVHDDPEVANYKKFPTMAGYPPRKDKIFPGNGDLYPASDLAKVAQSVGRPDRVNCGTCHFNGGGGDGVKHGDLDSSLVEPKKSLDVHMDAEGLDFACSRCHTTKEHHIAGRLYTIPAAPERISLTEADLASKITCESCHSATPHKNNAKSNDHTDKVGCQACHIPTFARVKPTKMWWDWSKAGRKNEEGKPFSRDGEFGKHSYNSKKGEFIWGKNVVPEYRWFNGAMSHLLVTDKIDPDEVVRINQPVGSADDPRSRIMPFKVHRGKQPYDPVNNNLVLLHLWDKHKGEGAYWKDWDWTKAIQTAMDSVGLPYSSEVGFVETEYYYPTTHMVAPKDNVVACSECHTRVEGSRMAGIDGVYIPGRDQNIYLNGVGWTVVLASLVGVLLHGLGRVVLRKKEG